MTFDLFSQQPTEEWVRTYNSPDNEADHFIDMATDRFGNLYQTGWNTTLTQRNNIVTVKYSSSGSQQWAVSYNGQGNASDIARGLAVDSSGNCYVAGYSGFNFGPYDGILIKYNLSGDTLWTRKLITILDDEFTNISVDINNFLYVSGRSGDSALVFKYDSTGNMMWRVSHYELQYISLSGKIRLDKFNNVYAGGTKYNFQDPFSADFLVRKYTQTGSLLWASTYNGPSNVADWMTGFVIDNSGNSYSTGYTEINGRDILTVKLNSSGTLQWAKFYNGASNASDQGNAVICDTSGSNIFVTGFTFIGGSSTNFITINYNSIGDTQWVRTYNGPGNYQDNAEDIAIDKQLNVYVTGGSSTNGFDFDVATVKYSSSGNQQWVTRWSSPANGGDGGSKMIVDYANNVYIGGNASAPGPNYLDLLAIKYSQSVGIIPISNIIPEEYKLEQNYPNPFNPVTNIKYQIVNNNSNVILTVFDVTGKHIIDLVNHKQKSGTYEVDFSGYGYSSGVYFYRLTVDGKRINTKKMILIK